jgi:tetratricopeptide (TPR) repeat protein
LTGRRRAPKAFLILCIAILASDVRSALGQGSTGAAQPVGNSRPQTAGLQPPLQLAEQFYRTGNLDAAAEEYSRVIQSEPASALAYVGLARVYLQQNKCSEAYRAADKAVELAPTFDVVRVARAEVYFRQGKIKEAEKEFTDLVRAGTTQARAYLGLSRLEKAASLYEQAKLAIDRAFDLDPADRDVLRERFGYLSLSEQIKALRVYLWSTIDDGSPERRDMANRLAVLEREAAEPNGPCRASANPNAMETNLEPFLYNAKTVRGYGVRVKLNGSSAKLLLDTGASGLVINRKVAERAGIKPVVEAEIRGAGDKGPAAGYIGYADSVAIGDLEFRDCYVAVVNSNSVAEDEGLIGADVFSRFLVDIDFPNTKFKLSQLPARPGETPGAAALNSRPSSDAPTLRDRYVAGEMRTFKPMLRFGHNLLIWTEVNDSAPRLFILDTGAFENIISPSAAKEVTNVSADSTLVVTGINGAVKGVFRADELTLGFANLRHKNKDVVALDTTKESSSIGTEVSGFLGFAMLRAFEIRIDYRDGLIDFEYNPNHLH